MAVKLQSLILPVCSQRKFEKHWYRRFYSY